MKHFFLAGFVLAIASVSAQKKPLDHTVYDSWQSISERQLSNNGRFAVFVVSPQEGDGELWLKTTAGASLMHIPRGYQAEFTEDNRYLVCRIKARFRETRDARIRKRKPDDMPKDSMAIVRLDDLSVKKYPRVKSFLLPQDSGEWIAWLYEKPFGEPGRGRGNMDSLARITALGRLADSLTRVADSLRNKLAEVRTTGLNALLPRPEARTAPVPGTRAEDAGEEGTELVLKNLSNGEEKHFRLVNDYLFDRNGTKLLIRFTKKNGDSLSAASVALFNLGSGKQHTILNGLHEARGFAFDEEGRQLAFVAERDSAAKAVQKYYKLWYYRDGSDSARLLADRFSTGIAQGWGVPESAQVRFSKSGARLFLGTAPILPPKDTSLPEFERAGLDIWNYHDDELQPAQLFNLNRDLRRSYTGMWDLAANRYIPYSDKAFRQVYLTRDGDGSVFYGTTDTGRRVASQWQGFTFSDIYSIDPPTGNRKLIQSNYKGNLYPSSTGKYLLIYNDRQKRFTVYNSETGKVSPLATDIKHALYDEENDVPDDPNPYGVARWTKDDEYVLIYDRFDIWKVDPAGKQTSVCLTGSAGRAGNLRFRYIVTDREKEYVSLSDTILLHVYNEKTKGSGIAVLMPGSTHPRMLLAEEVNIPAPSGGPGGGFGAAGIQKAKHATQLLYTKETFQHSPDLYTRSIFSDPETKLSSLNPQQENYTWGTAELFKWKAYTGKLTEGVLYKPDNFDPKKKYPMIVYFYERNNNTLYNYLPPSPTPSRLNIPFFVSRGYVVFVPDIWYTTGHPGQSAYDYIVSGTRALIRAGFVDSARIGLQGQSWGGYQTAYLVTRTHLYAAAWAGAPVANMFSAYGGIRWESGVNRQFQYEKTQSRIGATIWEKPQLYVENSPLFHLQSVTTPLMIMSNDADGAVPWYQGIELFTAMRRLNKPVWLLQYNGEAHNLVERRNRKDIQVREQQFFDWLLKGEKPPVWITEGVPALMKGRTWGLSTE